MANELDFISGDIGDLFSQAISEVNPDSLAAKIVGVARPAWAGEAAKRQPPPMKATDTLLLESRKRSNPAQEKRDSQDIELIQRVYKGNPLPSHDEIDEMFFTRDKQLFQTRQPGESHEDYIRRMKARMSTADSQVAERRRLYEQQNRLLRK